MVKSYNVTRTRLTIIAIEVIMLKGKFAVYIEILEELVELK